MITCIPGFYMCDKCCSNVFFQSFNTISLNDKLTDNSGRAGLEHFVNRDSIRIFSDDVYLASRMNE